MSDGHFNNTFLPRTDYQSGMRVGMVRMKSLAEQAFEQTLAEILTLTKEQRQQAQETFRHKLSQHN